MKILVVEDDPNLRALWGAALERAGHETLQVATETSALTALQARGFDLVVLDLCMSGRNALGVATLANYRNPACKVVVISGSAVYSQKKLFAMSPAVAAALRKPVDIEDLLEVCEMVARNRRPPSIRAPAAATVEFRP